MDIKRIFEKDGKFILQVIFIIVAVFVGIKYLNAYYENDEKQKLIEMNQNSNDESIEVIEENYAIESNSIENTMRSFVNYCNNGEVSNAYQMLTQECKNAMFPTEEYLKTTYIEKIYNTKRKYEMIKWSTNGNKTTYLVKLYGDLLATGGSKDNYTEDYYTFIKNDNGTYKININKYIYGEQRNIEQTVNGLTIKIEYVDVYEQYEDVKITIVNNSHQKICLNGNKYLKKIYLQNTQGTKYSSINSKFDIEEVILRPNETQTLWVEFNKVYSSTNKAQYLVFSDIIFNYEDYLIDKNNYSNRTSLNIKYQN